MLFFVSLSLFFQFYFFVYLSDPKWIQPNDDDRNWCVCVCVWHEHQLVERIFYFIYFFLKNIFGKFLVGFPFFSTLFQHSLLMIMMTINDQMKCCCCCWWKSWSNLAFFLILPEFSFFFFWSAINRIDHQIFFLFFSEIFSYFTLFLILFPFFYFDICVFGWVQMKIIFFGKWLIEIFFSGNFNKKTRMT